MNQLREIGAEGRDIAIKRAVEMMDVAGMHDPSARMAELKMIDERFTTGSGPWNYALGEGVESVLRVSFGQMDDPPEIERLAPDQALRLAAALVGVDLDEDVETQPTATVDADEHAEIYGDTKTHPTFAQPGETLTVSMPSSPTSTPPSDHPAISQSVGGTP